MTEEKYKQALAEIEAKYLPLIQVAEAAVAAAASERETLIAARRAVEADLDVYYRAAQDKPRIDEIVARGPPKVNGRG